MENKYYPVLPLRNMLMTPFVITPILVGRQGSLDAVENAQASGQKVICLTQHEDVPGDEDPPASALHRQGVLCEVAQVFRMPDGAVRVLLEGQERVRVTRFRRARSAALTARCEEIVFQLPSDAIQIQAQMRAFRHTFTEYVQTTKAIPEEALGALDAIKRPDELFFFILANVQLDIPRKMTFFPRTDYDQAVLDLSEILLREIEIANLEKNIDSQVRDRLGKIQREYYLNEQLKIIHNELGLGDDEQEDVQRFRELLASTPLNEEAARRAEEEIRKLSRIPRHSQEYVVVYNYLSWIFDLPWKPAIQEPFEIAGAAEILDADHYGLKKVKERILEYLAVMKLAGRSKGQILCFIGPPGVGKTSLGKSIARALGRSFVRLSLGGVRDEAEIRGHRRTYVGALPGVIIQSMKKAGSRNPLIMMDEVDKMSVDFRGDPSAALLEVLDPEQNRQFRDHFLDFEYDLSDVLFITTANNLGAIPQPLADRMEIIHLSGYTSFEKLRIAERHLLPRKLGELEIHDRFKTSFEPGVLDRIIEEYTREAGVRELERKIAAVLRKLVRRYVEKPFRKPVKVKAADLREYLGAPSHLETEVNRVSRPGVVTGLAWTANGGETLQIEVLTMKGTGKIKLTGKLGEIMQESAQAALSWARCHAKEYDIDPDFPRKIDLHLHIPEGAIPKDGPSAGVTMTTAIVSALSGKPVEHNLAMTGEITLIGDVLPIGGLEEKLLAAKRARIDTVLIPERNRVHLEEIKPEALEGLNVIPVDRLEKVLEIAFGTRKTHSQSEPPITTGRTRRKI
jgi:ATP-dependent Lon protease